MTTNLDSLQLEGSPSAVFTYGVCRHWQGLNLKHVFAGAVLSTVLVGVASTWIITCVETKNKPESEQ
jgi:hypothetical protein